MIGFQDHPTHVEGFHYFPERLLRTRGNYHGVYLAMRKETGGIVYYDHGIFAIRDDRCNGQEALRHYNPAVPTP